MTQFPSDARVSVTPIVHQQEGVRVTIGDLRRQVFLTIPAEGLEILTALEANKTVGEAVRLYEEAHGETPDIEDFLACLAEAGFVRPRDEQARAPEIAATERSASAERISPALAGRLFGPPLLVVCGLVVTAAIGLLASDPGALPGPSVLVFHRHLAAFAAALFAVTAGGVLMHEAAHLLAARAAAVPARIGVGHRLWILVAETDMTGIWMAPKRRRYLAFLAGPIVDATSAAILVSVLWAWRRGLIGLSPTLAQFTGAALYSFLLRLLWQCFVFVRTDFYFVLATALDCKSLLADTEDLLRNRLARLRRRPAVVDQSAIPPREMRAVRVYALVWLGGRVLALASLLLVTLPVLGGYAVEVARALSGRRASYGTVDLLTLGVIGVGMQGAGLYIWIRDLLRGRTQRRNDAVAAQ